MMLMMVMGVRVSIESAELIQPGIFTGTGCRSRSGGSVTG